MRINADEYTTKKRSDDDSSSSHENNNNYDGNSNNYSATINSDKKLTKGMLLLLLSSWSSLVQLAFGNKRYFRIFLIATIAYGILFLQISSILVYRSDSRPKSMLVIEGKVAAGNNIHRRICVCTAQQRKSSKVI
jgi:hypothetical protein